MIIRTPRGEGCCGWCRGTGYDRTMSPETNGMCADCRGTGCAHDGPCGKDGRRILCVGGVVTGELQTEVFVHVASDDLVVTGRVPVPLQMYPELRRSALRMAFEAADRRFTDARIDELMRRDDG